MPAPVIGPADVLALSFVAGLPRLSLYPVLRGDMPATDACLPFDGVPPEEEETRTGSDALEALIVRVQRVERARRPPDRRDAAMLAAEGRCGAARAVETARNVAVEPIAWGDARYPWLLAEIFDPPLVLWVRGRVDLLNMALIAIVGSRAASSYGEDTAARLAREIASNGIPIVSGLARGIDGAAHRGALEAGGTVAVLGCGPDVVYPREHRDLMNEVVSHGVVASEYPPGTQPLPYHFPCRNRIISGLSRAVVVVEAWRRSGALITANCALDQGREVMAVPGNVLSERHRGSHMLIKCGAALVETATDVLQALKLASGPTTKAGLSDSDPLLDAMEPGDGSDLDALAARCGSDAATLLPRLLDLELQGRVRRLPGGRFVRAAAP